MNPWKSLLVAVPLLAFLGLAGLFYARLQTGDDASKIPSPLIGKPVPVFSLPVLASSPPANLTDADLRQGHVSIVNIFASWCVPCHDENPVFATLARDPLLVGKGIRLIGIAYKDQIGDTEAFLRTDGNPYAKIGVDKPGRTAIDWGVYGVPETFIVKGDGTIAQKIIGVVTPEIVEGTIMPALRKLVQ